MWCERCKLGMFELHQHTLSLDIEPHAEPIGLVRYHRKHKVHVYLCQNCGSLRLVVDSPKEVLADDGIVSGVM